MPTRTCSRLFALLAALLVMTLTLAGCGRGTPPPATVDTEEEPRIVAFSPAVAVILRDIGLEDRIVGKHAYDLVLPERVPAVGDLLGIDYEALLRTEPTLVITQFQSAGVPERLAELAERRGFELRDYPLLSLDDVARAADDLYMDLVHGGVGPPDAGSLLAGEGPGSPEAWLDVRLPGERLGQALRDRGPASRGAGRVLLLGSLDPPSAMGPGSFHHDMLVRIGGAPAITEGAAWIALDAEDVVRLAPDAIVVFAPRAPTRTPTDDDRFGEPETPSWDEIQARLGRLATRDIPALRARRVAVIDHPLGLLPSTAVGDVADELARVLAGWSASGESADDAP